MTGFQVSGTQVRKNKERPDPSRVAIEETCAELRNIGLWEDPALGRGTSTCICPCTSPHLQMFRLEVAMSQ